MGFTSALLFGFSTARFFVPPGAPRWEQQPARHPGSVWEQQPVPAPAQTSFLRETVHAGAPAAGIPLLPAENWRHDFEAPDDIPLPPAQAGRSGFGPAAFAIGGLLALSVGYSRSGLMAATATRGEAVVEAPPLQPPRDRQEMLKQAQQAIQRASEAGVRRRMKK